MLGYLIYLFEKFKLQIISFFIKYYNLIFNKNLINKSVKRDEYALKYWLLIRKEHQKGRKLVINKDILKKSRLKYRKKLFLIKNRLNITNNEEIILREQTIFKKYDDLKYKIKDMQFKSYKNSKNSLNFIFFTLRKSRIFYLDRIFYYFDKYFLKFIYFIFLCFFFYYLFYFFPQILNFMNNKYNLFGYQKYFSDNFFLTNDIDYYANYNDGLYNKLKLNLNGQNSIFRGPVKYDLERNVRYFNNSYTKFFNEPISEGSYDLNFFARDYYYINYNFYPGTMPSKMKRDLSFFGAEKVKFSEELDKYLELFWVRAPTLVTKNPIFDLGNQNNINFLINYKFLEKVSLKNPHYIIEYLNHIKQKYSSLDYHYDFLHHTIVSDAFLCSFYQEKLSILEKFFIKDFSFMYKVFLIEENFFKMFVNVFDLNRNCIKKGVKLNMYRDFFSNFPTELTDRHPRIVRKRIRQYFSRNVFQGFIETKKTIMDVTRRKKLTEYDLRKDIFAFRDIYVKLNFNLHEIKRNKILLFLYKIYLQTFINDESFKRDSFFDIITTMEYCDFYDVFNYVCYSRKKQDLFYLNLDKNISKNFFIENMVNFSLTRKIENYFYFPIMSDLSETFNSFDLMDKITRSKRSFYDEFDRIAIHDFYGLFYKHYYFPSYGKIKDSFMYFLKYRNRKQLLYPYHEGFIFKAPVRRSEEEDSRYQYRVATKVASFFNYISSLAVYFDMILNSKREMFLSFGQINDFIDIEAPRFGIYDNLYSDFILFNKSLDSVFQIEIPDNVLKLDYLSLYKISLKFEDFKNLLKILKELKLKETLHLKISKIFKFWFKNPLYLEKLLIENYNLSFFSLSYFLEDISIKNLNKYLYYDFLDDQIVSFSFNPVLDINFNIKKEKNHMFESNYSFFKYILTLNALNFVLKVKDQTEAVFFDLNKNYKGFLYKGFQKQRSFLLLKYLKGPIFNFLNNETIFNASYIYNGHPKFISGRYTLSVYRSELFTDYGEEIDNRFTTDVEDRFSAQKKMEYFIFSEKNYRLMYFLNYISYFLRHKEYDFDIYVNRRISEFLSRDFKKYYIQSYSVFNKDEIFKKSIFSLFYWLFDDVFANFRYNLFRQLFPDDLFFDLNSYFLLFSKTYNMDRDVKTYTRSEIRHISFDYLKDIGHEILFGFFDEKLLGFFDAEGRKGLFLNMLIDYKMHYKYYYEILHEKSVFTGVFFFPLYYDGIFEKIFFYYRHFFCGDFFFKKVKKLFPESWLNLLGIELKSGNDVEIYDPYKGLLKLKKDFSIDLLVKSSKDFIEKNKEFQITSSSIKEFFFNFNIYSTFYNTPLYFFIGFYGYHLRYWEHGLTETQYYFLSPILFPFRLFINILTYNPLVPKEERTAENLMFFLYKAYAFTSESPEGFYERLKNNELALVKRQRFIEYYHNLYNYGYFGPYDFYDLDLNGIFACHDILLKNNFYYVTNFKVNHVFNTDLINNFHDLVGKNENYFDYIDFQPEIMFYDQYYYNYMFL